MRGGGSLGGILGGGPTQGVSIRMALKETALREDCAASKLRCEETALRANGSAGMRGA